MKSITPDVRATHARIFTALFISFIILVTPVLPVMAATARLANDVKSKLPTTDIRPADAGAVIPSEALSPLPLPAPNITASKTDSFPAHPSGKAEPGDIIGYTINVNNSGADDATGVTFNDTIDANTTLVPSSLKVSPLAFADTYVTEQDTALNIAAPGVLANDTGLPAPTAVPIAGGSTTGGGTVTLNADGSFNYTPASGFTGADTFTYTATNTQPPNDTATVTINVDAAPTVTATNPADDATNQSPNTNITITFSEPVNVTGNWFQIACSVSGTRNPADTAVTGGPTTYTINPNADFTAPESCTVTVFAAQVTDQDTNDAPDNMAANYVFNFDVNIAPPVAVDDMRSATGNIRIDTSGSGYSVLTNDIGTGLLITGSDMLSAHGGEVTVNTLTGTFSYNPPVGYEGPDSFNYTITNGAGSDVGTVNITVNDMIWFVNNTAGACASNCNGRLTNPFTTLAALEAVNGDATMDGAEFIDPHEFDDIFIYTGVGDYVGPLTLENSQILIGQGAISSIPALTGVTPTTDSDPLPATGGVNPSITNPSGVGITVAQDNNLHGLTVTNTSSTGVSGSNFGTLTVSEHVIVNNTTGVPVSLSTGTLAATFQSISSNGATNGIVLNTTTGSFTVSGNGGSCTSAASCTGGAILNSTSGVSLTNSTNVSLDRVFIQNSVDSGIKGTKVNGFSFTNGVIDNSGTGGVAETSNIAFNNVTVGGTDNNLSGTLTVTGSTLTNAFYHGVDVLNFDGTLSDVNISNNTITSTNSTATSKGSGIRLVASGSATTAANVTKATIANNVISNFPSGAGIIAQGGNANVAGLAPAGTYGVAGSLTDIINITGNTIKGFSAVNRIGTFAIQASVAGRGQGNYNISNNGTVANPITNIAGTVIVHSSLGVANVTSTIANNVIVANHAVAFGGPSGISIGVDQVALIGNTASLTTAVKDNIISQVDGVGINAVARQLTTMNITVKNNTVAAPLSGFRSGIRVDSNNVANNTNVCLDIVTNTTAGAGGAPGISLRKQGTNPAVNVFGIEGLSPSPATAAQTAAFVSSQNPASAGGTLIVAGDNFVSCSSAPVAMYMPETNGSDALAQLAGSESNDSASALSITQARSIFNDATAGAIQARASFEEQALASNFSNESAAQMRLSHGRKMSKARGLMGASASATGHFLNPMPSGETINHTIGTLPAGKSVTITFQVTLNNPLPSSVTQVSNQGTISGSNFLSVVTDDPAVSPGVTDPTVTPVLSNPDISINDASVAEPALGSANATFSVVLAHAFSQTVTVNFTTANDTGGANPATAGTDYTTTSGTLTFNPGETIQTISVPVLADGDTGETDETFLVNLSGATNGAIADSQATGTITVNNTGGTVLISELRTSGPGGPDDDFVEILNATDSDITVPESGWALVMSGASCSDTPVVIAVIPGGTVIPARGNYLLTGLTYSLAGYAAGNQVLSANIENDRNVALFDTANPSNFQTSTRLDAVGFGTNTGNNCDLLREGATLPAASGSTSEYSFVRKVDKGETVDHNNSSVDFTVVSTTPGTAVGDNTTPTLGAPGPERSTSPRGPVPCNAPGTAKFGRDMLDSTQDANSAPNVVRDATPDIPNNSTFGTIDFRRRFTNNTGGAVTQLRYRIVDMTTSPSPSGTADLRARTSLPTLVAGINDTVTCGGATPCSVTVEGTLLETPPLQALGGGVNSTLAVGTITLGTPLANGSDVKLHFLFGVQQVGDYHIGIVIETLTAGTIGKDIWELNGNTETGNHTDGDCNTAPVANAGADQMLECAGGAANVTLDGSESSDADGDTLTYEWREGVTVLGTTETLNISLPFGPHTITLKVTDPSGAFDEDTVQIDIVDTVDPTIIAPPDVSASTGPGATSCGAVVTEAQLGTASASDGCSATVNVTRTRSDSLPISDPYPVGITTITYTADDGHGNTASDTQTVTVTDNTPPVVNAPPDQLMVPSDPGMCSATVNPGTATATDNCDSSVTITATRSDGQPLNAPYPVGTTTITWKGTDDANNMGTDTQTITVKDANAPVIVLTSSILKLWPPNHSYNTFNVTELVASVSDLCDTSVDINDVVITKVTSDEPEDGPGDGNTLNDIVIANNCKSVQLRAERNGDANGRVYKITLQVKDSSGNIATAVRQVIVPITSTGSAIDSGVQYTVNGACPIPLP